MDSQIKTKRQVVRVGGRLRELTIIKDEKGNVLHKILSPIMLEFRPKDILQVIVGATVLAIPIAYTEETWNLGQSLPFANILGFLIISLVFISAFVYYNYYRKDFKNHKQEFVKRVISTYALSFAVVSCLLLLIDQAPWTTDWLLAFKRTVIVTFPASMSATIADVIK